MFLNIFANGGINMKKYIVVIKTKYREQYETDNAFLFKVKKEEDLIKEVASIIGCGDEGITHGFRYTTLKLFLKYHFMANAKYVRFNWKELRGGHNE